MNIVTAIREVKKIASKNSNIELIENDNYVAVKSKIKNGFDMLLNFENNQYNIYFASWHRTFPKDKAKDSVEMFMFGLSNKCRLKVTSRGETDYKWCLEYIENDEWKELSTTKNTTPITKFWQKNTIRYLSNATQ